MEQYNRNIRGSRVQSLHMASQARGNRVLKSTDRLYAALDVRVYRELGVEHFVGLADRDLEREPIPGGGYPRRLDSMRAQPLINRLGCLRRGRSKRFNL